jgi:hypothetical protein
VSAESALLALDLQELINNPRLRDAGSRLQQQLDCFAHVNSQLRVLGYDLLAYADLERPAILAIETMRIEISEQVETFAH